VHGWPTLRRWLDEHKDDAAFVEQIRTAARQWEAKGRDHGLLWRGDALAEYERWRGRHAARLTPSEAAFGAASVADAARGRRIRRAIAVTALALVTVFFVGLWRANLTANHAKRQAEALLRDSYFEQGRLRVLEGDRLGALAPLASAYRMGSTGPATRLLLEQAARPTRARLLKLEGHTDKLWDVAYSPDGRWLATASTDHTARVWDAETGAPRATLQHADWVTTVAWSPTSRLVASGGSDLTVRVWDVIAGREVAVLPAGMNTRRIAFSPDEATLLTTSGANAVKLWRLPDGTPAGELAHHRQPRGATFSEDGTCIVTWDAARIAVWDAATLAARASYTLEKSVIHAAAVSRSHDLLAIGTLAGELVLLRGDGAVIAKRVAHDHTILDLAISPDETVVATASSDGTVRLWSAAGEPRGTLAGHRANVSAVRFTPAGDRILTTSSDSTARLWTVSGMLLGELSGHANAILRASVRPDGAHVATASWDRTAIVWDLARAQEYVPILTPRGFAPRIAAFDPSGHRIAAFAPSGRRIAVAADDGALAIADAGTGAIDCTAPGGLAIAQLAWTGEDELAVLRRGAQAIELWDLRRCTAPTILPHPAPIAVMSVRPGPRLATAAGNVVRVFRGGQLEATFTGYAGRIEHVAIDGDDVLATTEAPAALVVDAIGEPARRRIFRAGTKEVTDVRFDRERGRIAGASLDQFLYVWDAATGALVNKLEGTGPLWGVRTSPDGALAIGVGGVSPTVWDRASGARLHQLEGHSDLVRDGAFLGDRLFLSLAWNRTAIVWDVDSGRALTRFHEVDEIAVSEARGTVALVGATGVRIWTPRTPVPDLDALRARGAP
jgi:WD40 repeat protein